MDYQEMDIVPQTPYQRLAPLRNDPQLRLNTFMNWPSNALVSPNDLCNDGFYYTGLEDKVQCTHCGGILSCWEPGDIVAHEHSIHFPQCPLVIARRNNPFFQPATTPQQCGPLTIGDGSGGFNFGHHTSTGDILSLRYQQTNHPADKPGTSRPKYPEYALESNRLTTFKGWPTQLSQKPEALAKSGLFYLGQGDRCKCFFCGGILYDWDTNDDVWIEHAKWFSDCPWLKLSKGEPFIRQVLQDMQQQSQNQGVTSVSDQLQSGLSGIGVGQGTSQSPNPSTSGQNHQTIPKIIDDVPSTSGVGPSNAPTHMSSQPNQSSSVKSGTSTSETKVASGVSGSSLSSATSDDESTSDIKSIIKENQTLKDERTCKICMDDEVSIVFLPCGHLACCAECAVNVDDCPICRTKIGQKIKAYWSL